LIAAIQGIDSPSGLADLATAYMDIKAEEKQESSKPSTSLHGWTRFACARTTHRGAPTIRRNRKQTKASLDERQREVLLREQMAAIQKQLGEGEEAKLPS